MKKAIILVIALFLFCSCSTMYFKPTIQPTLYKQTIPYGAALVLKSAGKIMPALGYKIDGMNTSGDTITTQPTTMTINPGDCDCGEVLGLPVVKSSGIKAKVYFIMNVTGNELSIKADIEPEMTGALSALASAGLTVACVSKGGLEKALAKQFLEKMAGKAIQNLIGM